jgi:hypothetical protein
MKRRVLAIAVLAILGANGKAEAVNNTIGTALQGALGEKRVQTLAAGAVGYYGFEFKSDRSYAAFCWISTFEHQGAFANWCDVDIRNFSDGVVASYACCITLDTFPKAGVGSFYSTTTGCFCYVRILNNTGATHTINLMVVETTLASPWYFVSPASGYDTYVEIRNHSTSTLDVRVRAYANTGGLAAGSTTVSVPANGNTYVAVSSLGIANGSGSLTITYNGMPGAIVRDGGRASC